MKNQILAQMKIMTIVLIDINARIMESDRIIARWDCHKAMEMLMMETLQRMRVIAIVSWITLVVNAKKVDVPNLTE